jgi:hypothetical protein
MRGRPAAPSARQLKFWNEIAIAVKRQFVTIGWIGVEDAKTINYIVFSACSSVTKKQQNIPAIGVIRITKIPGIPHAQPAGVILPKPNTNPQLRR